MKVNLKHSQSGLVKEVKVGFSWTLFFLGILVPLVRGDVKWFFLMLLIDIVTFGIAWFVFPFVYNKIFIKGLLEKGYVPADDHSRSFLANEGIWFADKN